MASFVPGFARSSSERNRRVLRHRQHELVRGELDGRAQQPVAVKLVGELGVRRRVDVDLRSLADLRGELVGAGERQLHVRVLFLAELRCSSSRAPPSSTRPPTRRGAVEPRAAAAVVVAAAAAPQRAPRSRRPRTNQRLIRQLFRSSPTSPSRPPSPARRGPGPSSSTASRVTAAVTRKGPPRSPRPPSRRPPRPSAPRPGSGCAASERRPVRWRVGCPASRSTSRRGTRRRFAASRLVRSFP